MHTSIKNIFAIASLLTLVVPIASHARADDPGRGHNGYERGQRESRTEHNYHHDDSRRHSPPPRYTPAHGRVVPHLPSRREVAVYRGRPYHYAGGVWYRPYGPHYVVTRPPRGAFVHVLPWPYVFFHWYGRPYYYVNNVYYTPAASGYVVTDPPPGVAAAPSETLDDGNEILEEPIVEEPIAPQN